MTVFIPGYDVESPDCLEGVKNILKVHEKHEVPATFFTVASLLDKQGNDYLSLLKDHPLIEIASHTMTHMLLREHGYCGKPGPEEKYKEEIIGSKQRLEEHFECPVSGFRPAVGFYNGLSGASHLLELCGEAGYTYISSLAWGPHETLPALVRDPFTYAENGFPELLEIPAHGWHENVMKGHTNSEPFPVQLFPHPLPDAALTGYITTVEEEVNIHTAVINKALSTDKGHSTLIWHPWSLHKFDPEMKMVDSILTYVKEKGMEASTFDEYAESLEVSSKQPQ
jgi:peptidoglycan/xylan/chitin deacetylase (PgdA/CDA1 family)